jgi:N-acetyltransferase 10
MSVTVRKKIDSRIKTLLENGVKANHRSFIVIVGDRAREQIVNVHYLLSKERRCCVLLFPTVLFLTCFLPGLCEGASNRSMVLQERARLFRQQEEANQEDEEAGAARVARGQQERSV